MGLREEDPTKVTFVTWDKVLRMVETRELLMLFIGPVRAFLIPRAAGSDQLAHLMREVEAHRPDLALAPGEKRVDEE